MDHLLIPSFKVGQENQEFAKKGLYGDRHLSGACQSASIEVISGLSANMGFVPENLGNIPKIDYPCVFAINDTNL